MMDTGVTAASVCVCRKNIYIYFYYICLPAPAWASDTSTGTSEINHPNTGYPKTRADLSDCCEANRSTQIPGQKRAYHPADVRDDGAALANRPLW